MVRRRGGGDGDDDGGVHTPPLRDGRKFYFSNACCSVLRVSTVIVFFVFVFPPKYCTLGKGVR